MQNTRELPRGLETYEFYRDIEVDRKGLPVLHFTPRHNPATGKPVLTPNCEPDLRPMQWAEIFKTDKECVEMEIGSGKGGFLIEYARKHPELNIIGSEWDTTWAVYAGERMLKHQIDNAQMLRGDVYFFLRDRIPDNSIDAFHMYFPDPWPKKRQHKNRLLRPEFLVQVARTLKAGKRLFYWGTDHEEYNEWALEIFSQTPNVRFLVKNEAEPTEGIMTNFEKKYRKEGRPIYRSVLEFSK